MMDFANPCKKERKQDSGLVFRDKRHCHVNHCTVP